MSVTNPSENPAASLPVSRTPASVYEMAGQFQAAVGQTNRVVPTLLDAGEAELRQDMLAEEVQELTDAVEAGDIVEIADALADICYIVAGTAHAYGINLDAVLAEVHRSNMSKLGPDGVALFREDGKVIKGPWFKEPDVLSVLRQFGPVPPLQRPGVERRGA